jgi:predicted nucleic acid-binding protein
LILVDSNVWIDVIQRDSIWMEWSLDQLATAAQTDELAINPIICAEIAPNFNTQEPFLHFLKSTKAKNLALGSQCVYLAGRTHLKYRQNKRLDKSLIVGVLADFFIGAHAQTEGLTILTRDSARYKTYFPSVNLICP